MLRPSEFRDLVSGRRRGLTAHGARSLLRVAEVPYTIAVNWRNRRYEQGRADVHRVAVPVISIGNLTLGGTGKTPMVKWLVRRLQSAGHRVAIVSRGYGAENGKQNDEALELAAALPNVPHVQNRDRVAAAQLAIAEFDPSVIVLDDGFQHRRLARDLDIVLLDALEPFGFDHVFPRGTLREPLAGLRRAQVICLSRADAIPADQRDAIHKRVAEIAPLALWCELAHAPASLTNSKGETQPLDILSARRTVAFCGIGNPAGFCHTLTATGAQVAGWREFPDHHAFTPADQASLIQTAADCRADLLICTQKDLVKLQNPQLGNIPLWAVSIEMKFLREQEGLERMLEEIVQKRSSGVVE